jgi:tol-pal system protein YbgF
MNGCSLPRRMARFSIFAVMLVLAGMSGTTVLAQNAAPDPAVARLEVRISELERDLRASTGQVEELSHQVRRLSDRLEKLSADVDYRLGQPGGGAPGASVAATSDQAISPAPRESTALGPAPPGPPLSARPPLDGPVPGEGPTVLGQLPESEFAAAAPPPSVPEPAPLAESSAPTAAALSAASPREQYASGFALLRKANYDEAEMAFQQFLRDNPNDPLADNARYWLGETFYARGQYAPAAEAFLDAYQRNKTGPKAPDSLLKLGMSLGSLQKIPEACATYDELRTAIPDAPVSIKTRAQKERAALGCK